MESQQQVKFLYDKKGLDSFEKGSFEKAIIYCNEYLSLYNDNNETRWLLICSLLGAGYLIDAVGFIFTLYDENDELAAQYVKHFGPEDYRDAVHCELTDLEQDDLMAKIFYRIKLTIDQSGNDNLYDLIQCKS